MATLILTSVGSLIGGPVGGAIGALLGQSIDARLFGPKGRKGPRLDELRVQTSSYGSAVPRLYGRMRVSGTVIWSTDLVEHRNRHSNGKGRGSTTTYSYSVSMAVALSSRPLLRVGRIWAEGNLLRGDDGVFKSPVTFRLHDGSEDQPVDPLIAAAEGLEAAPAYRGMAYALFEDFDLAPFGNRVPSLTFEVIADDGAIALADPLADVLEQAETVESGVAIAGAALAADSREAALAEFERLLPVHRRPGAQRWQIGSDATGAPVLPSEVAKGGDEQQLASDGAVPQQVVLIAYDPDRDFQLGTQSARVAGAAGPGERLAVPLALEAAVAKAEVGRLARKAARGRRRLTRMQGFAALAIAPASHVRLRADGAPMIVDERVIEGATVRLSLEEDAADRLESVTADAGRARLSPDLAAGETRAALFDLPAVDGADQAGAKLVVAAGGAAGWRGARLSYRASAGALASDAGGIGPAGSLGRIIATTPVDRFGLIDTGGTLIVELPDAGATLLDADDAALLAGTNLAAAGGELLQFGRAVLLGGGRWRLSRLLRGRLGTEDAAGRQQAGDGFVLLDDAGLVSLPAVPGLAAPAAGGEVLVQAAGDAVPLVLPIVAAGRAARPLPPVHGRYCWQADGALALRWIRRSRSGFGWTDGLDAPLDAREERYRLSLRAGSVAMQREANAASLVLSADDVALLRGGGSMLAVEIVQLGDLAVSLPLTLAIPLP